jgi:uncharacterized protein YxeA
MKKVLLIGLVLLLSVASSVMVFAEEPTDNEKPERVKTERSLEEREAAKAERQARLIELFETYNPTALVDYYEVQASHELFHETAKAEKEAVRAGFQAEKEAIKEAVQNEEMTREEAKAWFELFKADREALKVELDIIKANKQADVQANRELTKAVFQNIKSALEAEVVDEALIASLLDSLIPLLHEHVNIDYFYHDQVMTLINTL